MRNFVLLSAFLLAAACAPRGYPGLEPAPAGHVALCDTACGDSVGITFLGVGGFLIQHGNDAILTAPFFTAPRIGTMLSPMRPDTGRIDSLMRARVPRPRSVRAVLVGHSHYDHVLDLPYLFARWLPDRAVYAYGAHGLRWTFAAVPSFAPRIRDVEDGAGTAERPGTWTEVPGFRVMPLRSEHAPHLARGLYLLPRRIDGPRTEPPRFVTDYAEGTTLAWLIDVKDADGNVVFRLHYQDSGSSPPRGFAPAATLAERGVDVALICGASFAQVRGLYPDALLDSMHPRQVVVGHWEDFLLHNRRSPPPAVPATDFRALERRLAVYDRRAGTRHWVPLPGETRWFCACRRPPPSR